MVTNLKRQRKYDIVYNVGHKYWQQRRIRCGNRGNARKRNVQI